MIFHEEGKGGVAVAWTRTMEQGVGDQQADGPNPGWRVVV